MSYTTFQLPKRKRGFRLIYNPCQECREQQNRILGLLNRIPVSPFAHAYVSGRSTATSCLPHVGKRYVLKLDIESFFESITLKAFIKRTKEDIEKYVHSPVAAIQEELEKYCFIERKDNPEPERELPLTRTFDYFLPQGFVTSPAISNIYMIRADWLISRIAWMEFNEANYTRYADDILISSDSDNLTKIIPIVKDIFGRHHLRLNFKKIRLMSRNNRQGALGLVMNQKLSLPRQLRKNLRAALHQVKVGQRPMTPKLNGELAYANGIKNHGPSYSMDFYAARWKLREASKRI